MRFLLIFLLSTKIIFAQKEVQKSLQTQLINVPDNGTVYLEEGTFYFTSTLSLEGKKGVKIIGKGVDKTILSFKDQTQGAEGLRVSNAANIILKDFTLEDSKGDAIKAMEVKGISFTNLRTRWSGGPLKTNGGYGLYPVLCEGVLIENCEASDASDAGIYVGQSKDIEVKNCIAHHNVAGIEIENSIRARVYHNKAYQNTGGILVFDLPDLQVKNGGFCQVFENEIYENNLENFAPKGNIVGKVPQGTGILLLAANNTSIYQNKILNNKSVGIGIISYFMTENPIKDTEYDPYPYDIEIKENVFERRKEKATSKGRMGKMLKYKLRFGTKVPHIMYDGILKEGNTNAAVCILNNKNQSFVNLDAGNNFKNKSQDPSPYLCK